MDCCCMHSKADDKTAEQITPDNTDNYFTFPEILQK